MNSCILKIIIAAVGVSVTSAVWGRPLSCVDVSFGESDKTINWVLPALVHMSDSEIVETLRSCELRHRGSRSRHYLLVEREEDLGPKGARFDARSPGRSNSQRSWIWSGGRIVEGLGLGKRFSIREVVSGKRPREIYSVGTSIYWFILPTGKCWLSASYPWRESQGPCAQTAEVLFYVRYARRRRRYP